MRILVTNDDGIEAPGLAVLETIAQRLAGEKGEVWVVAPDGGRSGVSHCTSFDTPLSLSKRGAHRIAVDGYPADCVLVGLDKFKDKRPPDLVLSGINRGNNSAENVAYSGTVGAAIEATLQGLKAIALSQYLGPQNRGEASAVFSASAAHGEHIIRTLLESAPWDEDENYQLFYNVNFPPLPANEVKGVKATPQGLRQKGSFSLKPHDKNTPEMLRLRCIPQMTPSQTGSDGAANLAGFISLTPMRADLSAHECIAPLEKIFR